MKTLSDIRLEIDPERYYSPREISQKCWITNSNGEEAKTNYDQVLRLIRFGKLLSQDLLIIKVSRPSHGRSRPYEDRLLFINK